MSVLLNSALLAIKATKDLSDPAARAELLIQENILKLTDYHRVIATKLETRILTVGGIPETTSASAEIPNQDGEEIKKRADLHKYVSRKLYEFSQNEEWESPRHIKAYTLDLRPFDTYVSEHGLEKKAEGESKLVKDLKAVRTSYVTLLRNIEKYNQLTGLKLVSQASGSGSQAPDGSLKELQKACADKMVNYKKFAPFIESLILKPVGDFPLLNSNQPQTLRNSMVRAIVNSNNVIADLAAEVKCLKEMHDATRPLLSYFQTTLTMSRNGFETEGASSEFYDQISNSMETLQREYREILVPFYDLTDKTLTALANSGFCKLNRENVEKLEEYVTKREQLISTGLLPNDKVLPYIVLNEPVPENGYVKKRIVQEINLLGSGISVYYKEGTTRVEEPLVGIYDEGDKNLLEVIDIFNTIQKKWMLANNDFLASEARPHFFGAFPLFEERVAECDIIVKSVVTVDPKKIQRSEKEVLLKQEQITEFTLLIILNTTFQKNKDAPTPLFHLFTKEDLIKRYTTQVGMSIDRTMGAFTRIEALMQVVDQIEIVD